MPGHEVTSSTRAGAEAGLGVVAAGPQLGLEPPQGPEGRPQLRREEMPPTPHLHTQPLTNTGTPAHQSECCTVHHICFSFTVALLFSRTIFF